MTITADQAKTLIGSATRGPWTAEDSTVKDCHGWSIFVDEENRTAATATPGDAALAAAAPDLARTVIDQATEIERLKSELDRMGREYGI